jgi:hypothetical protein
VLTFEVFSLGLFERRMQLSLWQIREMSTLPSTLAQILGGTVAAQGEMKIVKPT